MEEATRPLTADERQVLERLRSSKPQGGAAFGAFIMFLIVSGVLLILSPESWQVGARSLLPVAAAALVAAVVFRRLRSGERHSEWRANVERDLAAGVALVTVARVTDAVRVEEAEDEGSSYYLELDDRRVLFLSGQYLYEPEEERRFPSTVVTVVRAPATGIVLGLTCEGTPLAPSATRAPFTTDEYDRGRVPRDGAVLDVDFASLRARGAKDR